MAEKYRPGTFIVTFAKTSKGIKYVILKRKKHWTGWEFPKGGINPEEDKYKTVTREVEEETGYEPERIIDFNIRGKYHYPKAFSDRPDIVGQTFHLFAAEIPKKKISIDESEHSDAQWMSYKEARDRVTFQNQKDCLDMVDDWLQKLQKFRNMKLPSGKILLAGKDKKTNEEVVGCSGYTEEVFHTEEPGSPFCVIKKFPVESPFNLKKPTKEDIRTAAIFCASKSQDWRDNKSDVIVQQFNGNDVKKPRKLKTKLGTFMVKNYKRLKIRKSEIEEFIEKNKSKKSKAKKKK